MIFNDPCTSSAAVPWPADWRLLLLFEKVHFAIAYFFDEMAGCRSKEVVGYGTIESES
jgi:hypothetical protein